MNQHANVKEIGGSVPLVKADPAAPVLKLLGPRALAIKGGTTFGAHVLHADHDVAMPELVPGTDYAVVLEDEAIKVVALTASTLADNVIGGFHFAPGGNASGRSGGDSTPQINPCSLWDRNFRPACPDPRGMALIDACGRKFWADIYLLGTNHLTDGTSKHGAVIADGNDRPQTPDGNYFKKLDYETALAVMKHHGKVLLSVEEFFAAAFGVTEKTVAPGEPERTCLDAARTSKFGLMQATGSMWVWGHDGDPDQPRASIFGGSWLSDDVAGSRRAGVAYLWPDDSGGDLGARGRGDHLQLG